MKPAAMPAARSQPLLLRHIRLDLPAKPNRPATQLRRRTRKRRMRASPSRQRRPANPHQLSRLAHPNQIKHHIRRPLPQPHLPRRASQTIHLAHDSDQRLHAGSNDPPNGGRTTVCRFGRNNRPTTRSTLTDAPHNRLQPHQHGQNFNLPDWEDRPTTRRDVQALPPTKKPANPGARVADRRAQPQA
jgi:hypothetical protein